jgi:adenosylcobalamin-dependent ribonucleoside-triphosphate reductase
MDELLLQPVTKLLPERVVSLSASVVNTLKPKKDNGTAKNGFSNGHSNGFSQKNGFHQQLNWVLTDQEIIQQVGLQTRVVSAASWDEKKMQKKMSVIERKLSTGLGRAVAKRTILRDEEDWVDVANRVALGNTALLPERMKQHREEEYKLMRKHIANATLLMSGRHLQHGDETQPTRNMEVFTNCSTASATFILFYLLLNGSGVGRSYDDDMCLVDWDYMPTVRCVLDDKHPDYVWGEDESVREARHKYAKVYWFEVPDSREGWSQAIEKIEVMAYEKKYKNDVLVLDFSKVRERGQPIRGMQNRPASGPKPLMHAIDKLSTIKNVGMKPWKQAMFADHYLAECVLVGGARRAARISTKIWTDADIFEFINIKKGGFLWSANNSVAVDEKFWEFRTKHAKRVFDAVMEASYKHDTGEPGFVNQHRFVQNDDKYNGYLDGKYAVSKKFSPSKQTQKLLAHIARNAAAKLHSQIPNPCGEISLNMLGGYCVIADVVPYFAANVEIAEEAFRVATRALIRVNAMDSLYNREVQRTNRIGVGMTGLHEFAWNVFGYGFRDLIDEEKSKDFWLVISRFKRAVVDEAERYSKFLGFTTPHTNTTIKPAGTTSKLFGLTEGAHLPAMREYIRWVQFRNDDPLINRYDKLGYPIKKLITYEGTTVIGFPTQPEICKLKMGKKLVTAGEATLEEQFQWLKLLEKYWIVGVDELGKPLPDTGNQVSYTLKYKKDKINFRKFKALMRKYQSQVKCCSVMPQQDVTAYEYQPEEAVPIAKFMHTLSEITGEMDEDIDLEALQCDTGACPI